MDNITKTPAYTTAAAAMHREQQQRLCEAISGDGLIVLPGYQKMQLQHDMAAPFWQEANFLWLTGVTYPGWAVLIDVATTTTVLVRPDLTEVEQLFEGSLSDREAMHSSGATEIISRVELRARVNAARAKGQTLYALKPETAHELGMQPNPAHRQLLDELQLSDGDYHDITPVLAKVRACKTQAELERITRAIAVSCDSFNVISGAIARYTSEAEIAADMTRDFIRAGGRHAYDPIVAGGVHATVLHYDRPTTETLRKDQAVLIDVGAHIDGYNADITRTFYDDATVDSNVRAAIQRVTEAQRHMISFIQPGGSIREFFQRVDDSMMQVLVDLGWLRSVQKDQLSRYFPHAIGHGLGVDVHEWFGGYDTFQPGMVLTVEPGIYDAVREIGVRIEDDILVTDRGTENLSIAAELGS